MQLLKHFKDLTIRPKNAEELKGLILQLAIQGKLTANWRKENPDVEPATELIKRIEKKKIQLIKEKKIKKEKPLPRINKDEVPFELPINWKWFNLGDLGNAQTGTTPPTKNPKNYGTFIPFLGPADISNSFMQYPIEGLSEEGLRKGRLIESNSLMMVCIGGSMGKCNINRKDVSCNQQINILTPICSPVEYVKVVCQSPYFQTEVWERSTGSATPMINKNKWLQIPISVPPLEEQKAIVEVVEALFKEVEQLEQLTLERISLKEDFVTSALNQLTTNNAKKEWGFLRDHFQTFFNESANIKKLRETVLQLAVQGKLTRDWRASHPEFVSGSNHASELLKRIQKEKAQLIKDKKIKKEKPLPPITKDEIPYELPEGWVWCRMIELCQYITDGTHQTPTYTEKGRMFLSAKNVKPFKFMPEEHKFVSEEDFEGYRRNRKPELNDILITRVGAGIGEATLIDQDLEFAIYVSVGLLKMFPGLLEPNYIVMWLNSPEGRQYSSKNTYGKGVSQGNLNLSLIRGFVVSLPPLEEQKAIVQKVNASMGLCDALEQEVQQGQEQREQLMQSCLREVFEGESSVEI
ncbi:restriction endonuclease subunit S [Yeosuana marina]|uniref:restriction endonuclease subunit S n=1 Tax=Yeosuana marina TaxID=1565536 RepID=UPI0030EC49F5|tara:strand:- start:9265 stop:11001 length:1737 start_codon:yes stop_codon:yes gene_type:complete